MKFLCILISMFIAATGAAAVPGKQQVSQATTKILSGKGEAFGGLAGAGFTLLDVRRTASKEKKIERIVFDVGDMSGSKIRGWPGYFHVELKDKPQRLILTFSQMPSSQVNSDKLKASLKGSSFIRQSDLSLDPVDSSLNLAFDLKEKTKVKAYQVSGKKETSKVVIDLISD